MYKLYCYLHRFPYFYNSLILAMMSFPISTPLPKTSSDDFVSLFRLHYKLKRVVM